MRGPHVDAGRPGFSRRPDPARASCSPIHQAWQLAADTALTPMVTAAAQEGDLVALEAFGDVGEWLGVGLANLVAAFDPDLVVIGGGVSMAGDRLLEPARRAFARRLLAAPNRVVPTLDPATLGVRAGVIGAGEMVGCP